MQDNEINHPFGKLFANHHQDYAQELFNIARGSNTDKPTDETALIEKAWAGDAARYIVSLETDLQKMRALFSSHNESKGAC